MATPAIAANAYASLAKIIGSGTGSGGGTGAVPGVQGASGATQSFSSLLKDSIGQVLDAGRKSDAQSVQMANGKANVVDVVTAVAETQVAVETMVSVRDKVIAAYEDILKMPI